MPGQHAQLARMGRARSSPILLQRFFLHHDDDILSLAMHPDKTTVATGQVRCCAQVQADAYGGLSCARAHCWLSSPPALAPCCGKPCLAAFCAWKSGRDSLRGRVGGHAGREGEDWECMLGVGNAS